MKTKISALSVSSSLILLGAIGIVSLSGCGSRNRSASDSYQAIAIEESELTGNSSLRFANRADANPFENSEQSGTATVSNSNSTADSCIAHAKTAANPFVETADEDELPTLTQTEIPTIASSTAKKMTLDGKKNPFAAFDNDSIESGTYLKTTPAKTVSSPSNEAFRTRWNDPTEEEIPTLSIINNQGVNQRMIFDSHLVPRRIEAIPNPDSKQRRLFSPVPLKKSLQDRLLMKKMQQKHGRLYAELKSANFSELQIRTIANEMMTDEKGDSVVTADHLVDRTKKKTRFSN